MPRWIVEICELRGCPVDIHADGDVAYRTARARKNKMLTDWLEWISRDPRRPYGPIDQRVLYAS